VPLIRRPFFLLRPFGDGCSMHNEPDRVLCSPQQPWKGSNRANEARRDSVSGEPPTHKSKGDSRKRNDPRIDDLSAMERVKQSE